MLTWINKCIHHTNLYGVKCFLAILYYLHGNCNSKFSCFGDLIDDVTGRSNVHVTPLQLIILTLCDITIDSFVILLI